jgi:hypothetical protein
MNFAVLEAGSCQDSDWEFGELRERHNGSRRCLPPADRKKRQTGRPHDPSCLPHLMRPARERCMNDPHTFMPVNLWSRWR